MGCQDWPRLLELACIDSEVEGFAREISEGDDNDEDTEAEEDTDVDEGEEAHIM